MKPSPLNGTHVAVLICTMVLFSKVAFAETSPAKTEENKVSIPIQVDLIQRLEKAGLHPSITQKVEPPQGFKMPEVPQTIKNEHLGPAEQVKMDQLERKRSEGKQTETEYHLEKDTLFRDSNLRY